MKIRAFQGLVPHPDHVNEVAAVPYDVVNRAEAAALAEGVPNSLLHVDRAEIDLPDSVSPYSDEVYAKAVENFKGLQASDVLVRETCPCVYLYRQTWGEHVQTGLTAVLHVDDYANDVIKKHEKTRPDKEDDRTRLVSELGANTGPIFLTYKETPEVDALVSCIMERDDPVYDIVAPDGVAHAVWRVQGGEEFVKLFQTIECCYVADGHHRSASAYRVGTERRESNPAHDGTEDYNWFLGVLFPANQLKILPYNRAVKDLHGLNPEQFLQKVGEVFSVEPAKDKEPPTGGECRMYLGGEWYRLSWQRDSAADPVTGLDVSVLQDRVLAPILGVDDPRTSDRISFVGGIRGTDELERLVDSGDFAVAFSVFAVSVQELMDVADAGQIMAPKCTWFEPKLRSGLFIHTF